MKQPLMVMCAPNGARRQKSDHPSLPTEPHELARCAEDILAAGASVLHLHVRDGQEQHSLDVDRYRQAIDAIRERVGDQLVIQVTTEACGVYSTKEQMRVVRDLRPEAVSLALRELCPEGGNRPESVARDFFHWLQGEKIWPQYILYSPEDVIRFEQLRERGIVPGEGLSALFVLGRYDKDLRGNPSDLSAFVNVASDDTHWSVCCFGEREHDAATNAVQSGGHVRVGFENNIYMKNGAEAADNAALVKQAVETGLASGRSIATADDIRALFL